MSIKDAQCLLIVLKKQDGSSYYAGDVDGIYGRMTRRAIEDFQRDFCGLPVTGQVDDATDKAMRHAVAYGMTFSGNSSNSSVPSTTGTFWDEIEYFDREEFRCQCGGKYCNGFHVEPDEAMVRTVDEIRRRLGVPISIVDAGGSGVRCPQHNANVGGVANSEHMYGRAADLHSSKSPEEMYRIAEEVLGNTGGLGLYSWGIHVDVGKYSRWAA